MTYFGMPFGMWALFAAPFRKQLTAVLGYDAATARAITKKAKQQYRQIIAGLPEFEKADRFKMNLVNCAMIGAFILSMPQRPEVDRLTDYYARSMMTAPMQWFCRKSGKSKFTAKDIAAMKGYRCPESRRPQPLFVEHGVLRIPGWQRLRGTLYQMRHLCADEGAGAVRPDPCPVPSGLHHERSGRCDKFCAAVHPCLRRTLLRLRIQKEGVTDDEGEGNLSFP